MLGRRARKRARAFRWGVGAVVLLVLTLWSAGLLTFVAQVPSQREAWAAQDRRVDAVVVLTGGSLRLETGLRLLAEGLGDRLFVSGVYRGTEVATLLERARVAGDRFDCCVVLGYDAVDTAGNALETARWMRDQNVRSIRLVTANYHMPRSLLEFRRLLPEADITPHPVFPGNVHVRRWFQWPGTAWLLISEYHKWLLTWPRYLWPRVALSTGATGHSRPSNHDEHWP